MVIEMDRLGGESSIATAGASKVVAGLKDWLGGRGGKWSVVQDTAQLVWRHGAYLSLTDSCITHLKAQGPSRTCNESKEEKHGPHCGAGHGTAGLAAWCAGRSARAFPENLRCPSVSSPRKPATRRAKPLE